MSPSDKRFILLEAAVTEVTLKIGLGLCAVGLLLWVLSERGLVPLGRW